MPIKKPETPTAVKVEDSVPIQVETQSPLAVTVEKDSYANLTGQTASTTSGTPHADARMLAAKRQNSINALWEYTQALLAVGLTAATIYTSVRVYPILDENGTANFAPVPETLKNALFVVLGFYFGRTNHARPTPTDPDGEGGKL